MKHSPLQLGQIQYPVLEFRANPDATESQIESPLSVSLASRIRYEVDGDHFASLMLSTTEGQAYSLRVEAFAMFRIDLSGCREAYKQNFNPAVVGVNVARLLFSSCREYVVTISSRGPYGPAHLPSMVIEPSDISLTFEEGSRDQILKDFFGLNEQQLEQLREAIKARVEAAKVAKKPKRPTRNERLKAGRKDGA